MNLQSTIQMRRRKRRKSIGRSIRTSACSKEPWKLLYYLKLFLTPKKIECVAMKEKYSWEEHRRERINLLGKKAHRQYLERLLSEVHRRKDVRTGD